MRLPGCRFLCWHIALDPAPYVVPAMSLARSNALHATQKTTAPPTREIFGFGSSLNQQNTGKACCYAACCDIIIALVRRCLALDSSPGKQEFFPQKHPTILVAFPLN